MHCTNVCALQALHERVSDLFRSFVFFLCMHAHVNDQARQQQQRSALKHYSTCARQQGCRCIEGEFRKQARMRWNYL